MAYKNNKKFFTDLKKRYLFELNHKILPFWTKFAIDESGAINNCITEAGVVVSRDRYYWGQGRALWTFAAQYNYIEKKQQWLDTAINLFNYICQHAFDEDGNCVYLTDGEGKVKKGAVSIHSDAFVLYGISEYFHATGDKHARDYMMRIYENTAGKLDHPDTVQTHPFDTPAGLRAHSVHMVFAHLYHKTGVYLDNYKIRQHGIRLAKELLILFYNGQKDALLEFSVIDPVKAAKNSEYLDIYNFGHGIEAMWFLMEIFSMEKDFSLLNIILHILRQNLERGWDQEYGGIWLEAKMRGLEVDYSNCPDKKPSWSHNEAMIAVLYAYFLTGDEFWLQWHSKLDNFVFSVFPNHDLEWTNWLDRACKKPIRAQDNLEMKCIFHTSRALMMQIMLCEKIIQKA
jgi:N-acylglucosamine 2-epimerase